MKLAYSSWLEVLPRCWATSVYYAGLRPRDLQRQSNPWNLGVLEAGQGPGISSGLFDRGNLGAVLLRHGQALRVSQERTLASPPVSETPIWPASYDQGKFMLTPAMQRAYLWGVRVATTGAPTVPAVQIFVSYARDDDALPPDSGGAKGFVTFLHEQLNYEFMDLGHPRPRIWRDVHRIARGEHFTSRMEEAIEASALLLVVLSKNWMASAYCRGELASFAKRWKEEGELGIRRRIVVVGKRHVDPGKRPSLLQGQEAYNFYTLRESDEVGVEQEFFARGKVRDERCIERVRELASYLWRTAEFIDRRSSPDGSIRPRARASVAASGPTIYVAKPASDMRGAYDRLIKELIGRSYVVVPDHAKEIPADGAALDYIDDALAQSEASVHLLGEKVGFKPDDLEPIVKLQLMRAARRVHSAAGAGEGASQHFRRLVWAPKQIEEGGASVGSSERDPLAVLAKFDVILESDKIEGGNLSRFIDFLSQHLVLMNAQPLAPPPSADAVMRVYLYHKPADLAYAVELADALQQRRIEALLPAIEGSPRELKNFHRTRLAECDAVALCWASASEVWVRAQSRELRDWHGLGRKRQFTYRSVVAGPPPGGQKSVIKHLFPPSEIDIIVDLTAKGHPSPDLLDRLAGGASSVAAP